MSDPTDNLVLEHLRYIRAQVDAIYEKVQEHDRRFDRIEELLQGLRRGNAEGVHPG